jgi:hypothetical protein
LISSYTESDSKIGMWHSGNLKRNSINMASDVASPASIADFLLIECKERGDILINLKLQKLLYYAQAWFLVGHNKKTSAADCSSQVFDQIF